MFFATWKPATDILRSGNQWLVKMELAGVSPSEVQLSVHDTVLSVKGRRRDLLLQSGYTCHSLEISYTDFARNLTFPSAIDTDTIQTEFSDGILRIYLSTQE